MANTLVVAAPFLQFKQITKRFPGVTALNAVTFGVEQGSCHALIGENGAGKSTLGKILCGICNADEGEILLGGTVVNPTTPLIAKKLGISIVHQELAFCPNLSIAENLCLGELPSHAGVLDRSSMRKRAASMLKEIGADLDVDQPISNLSTGQEQLVQIAGALGTQSQIIVMDEPTSSLSAGESEHLFTLLANLKRRGITIIYVSHRMEEIFRLCDTITVLRDGHHVVTEKVANTSPDRVVRQMIGREVSFQRPDHLQRDLGAEVLKVENLSSLGLFSNISFSVRAGEVLGFAGLIGAGRSEVAEAVFGLNPKATGCIHVAGAELQLGDVEGSLNRGIGFLPEDRKRLGLVLSMNCRENTSMATLNRMASFGFISNSDEKKLATKFAERLRVKTPSIETNIAALSGGNQQKIALAKWLARECKVLIVDEPTRGVDVGAKAEIHRLLDQLACEGMAIIVISSELPEIMNLARRIIVMRNGAVVGELPHNEFSQATVMRLMAGLGLEPA